MPALLGRYELMRPIAKGGMATVYLARVVGEGGFERLVAVKLMHPHIADEPDFVSMFLDEARLAARIRHPNVVPTLAVERGPEGLFLVMELVDGFPLSTVVRSLSQESRTFPVEVALRVMVDTLEGLHAAHELTDDTGSPLCLVHRDVSPQNILVGKDGVSRITDFGVAHARARLVSTQGATLKGKVAYLSPEQIVSGRIDRRSDLFAAGIVLWETLTARRLFRGETEGETMAQVLAGPKRTPHQVNPSVPTGISEVCMRALAAQPESRFQTALEMIEALETAARAEVEIAKPREVGAFVASLKVPEVPLELGKPRSGSGISAPTPGAAAATGSAVIPMVASTPPRAPAGRRRATLFVLGAAGLLSLAAIGGAVLVRSSNKQPAAAASSAGPMTTSAAPPPQSAALPSRTPEPAPALEPTSSSPSATASASATPSSTPPTRRPHPAMPTTGRPKGGAGYRPEEL